MSSVDAVGATYNETAAGGGKTRLPQDLGKTEFLELLVTQLKNQDPMNPVNNEQFITQLATFSSLEQLMSINEGVTKLAAGSELAENQGNNETETQA